MPNFSVIVPVWKTEYLAATLESVSRQTFADYEVVVCESRRLADFDRIVGQYRDSRMRIVHNETIPMVANWNRCMGYSKGDFCTMLCDDDMFAPEHLENIARLIQKYPELDVFHSRVRVVDGKGKVMHLSQSCGEYETAADFIYNRIAFDRMQYVSDFVYRTSRFREEGGFLERPSAWHTDADTSFEMAFPRGVAFSVSPTYSYRVSDSTVTSGVGPLDSLEASRLHFDYVESILPMIDASDPVIADILKRDLSQYRRKMNTLTLCDAMKRMNSLRAVLLARRYREKYPTDTAKVLVSAVKHLF